VYTISRGEEANRGISSSYNFETMLIKQAHDFHASIFKDFIVFQHTLFRKVN